MGNFCGSSKKSTVDIAPLDDPKRSPTVRLYGSPTGILTSYIRFALLYKPVSLNFIPSETPLFGFESESPVIEFGSETVSGSRETLLRFIDSKFPHPPLMVARDGFDETTPSIVKIALLQHRGVRWHVERMVRWGEDLATRGGRRTVDPAVGSPRMEVRKFARSYSLLLELMLEHAQMEERVLFPILEMADQGLCKGANEEHARDLPIMNGIKEDIKSIGVLDSGSPVCQEALCNLSARLKSLQEHCKEHFEAEERDLLPLVEATELSKEQERTVMEQCVEVMQGTHSHLFKFLIEGLLPQEAMHYLDLITKCIHKERAASILHAAVE